MQPLLETTASPPQRRSVPERTDPLALAGTCLPAAGEGAARLPAALEGSRLPQQSHGRPVPDSPRGVGYARRYRKPARARPGGGPPGVDPAAAGQGARGDAARRPGGQAGELTADFPKLLKP